MSIAVLACGAALGAQAPLQERAANRLLIDLVAVDSHGAPVMDLKPGDLEVWVSRYRVPVSAVTPVTPETDQRGGRLVVLILDDLTLPNELALRTQEIARRFVTRMMPEDRMAVVNLSGSPAVEPTDDPARLRRAIENYHIQPPVVRGDLLGAQVFKTIEAIVSQVSEASERRKTIVAIGAASLLDRPVMPQSMSVDTREDWTRAMRVMAFARTVYYVIEPASVGFAPITGTAAGGFAEFAGGHAFLNTNDVTAPVDRIMRESANYYLVEVGDPPIQRKAELRELSVKSLRRGVTIRARHTIPGTPGR